jgi:hypothetical protein
MPKSRKRQHSRKRHSPQLKKNSVSSATSKVKEFYKGLKIGKIVAVIIAVIGILSGYITIIAYSSPRISVTPLTATNPKDALSTSFSVTNQGSIYVYDVAIGARLKNFDVKYASDAPGSVFTRKRKNTASEEPEIGDISAMFPVDSFYGEIGPMHSAVMQMPFSMAGEEDIDIEIIVKYRPAWNFSQRIESFRFITIVALNGEIHWIPKPDANVNIEGL